MAGRKQNEMQRCFLRDELEENVSRLLLYYLSVCSLQVVHEIRNYPYPQLHLLALQGLNPSRHASAVRESYEVLLSQSHG